MSSRYLKLATFAAAIVVLAAGVYTAIRPPAPKPLPEPLPEPVPPAGVPQFDAAKYRAEPTVSVWIAEQGIIQDMPLEQYLEGVVAKEMDPDWPPEALAAQAIVSRTLSIYAIEKGTIRRLHRADLSTAKEELQAYGPERVNDNVRDAVRRTRGQILLYAGTLVNAIYSDCCGQVSATREESFPKEITVPTPYFQAVTDTCFTYAPVNVQKWLVNIPAAEVAEAVGYHGDPAEIKILARGPSGRALYIGTPDIRVDGAAFRRSLGFDRLKSTLITDMKLHGDNFVFEGRGWGNGAGLCQWGAYTYARQGWSAADIVKHYYVGAEVKKIWD